jgi:MoxR-like ATPase
MRHHIKKYGDWVSESRVNEGKIGDFLSSMTTKLKTLLAKIPGLQWLGYMFSGPGSWFLNLYMLYTEGKLNSGGRKPVFELYPSKTTREIIKEAMQQKGYKDYEFPEEDKTSYFDYEQSTPKKTDLGPTLEEQRMSEMNEAEETMKDIETIGYDTFEELLEKSILALRRGDGPGEPLLIWGAPGVGKTMTVRAAAEKYDMDMEVIVLSNVDPDSMMLAMIDMDTKKQRRVPMPRLPLYDKFSPTAKQDEDKLNRVDENGVKRGGILFFDELSRAPKAISDIAIPIIEDRAVDNFRIADGWIIIAAANRKEDEPGTTFHFSPALGNRYTHYNLVPTVEEWEKRVAKTLKKRSTGELYVDPLLVDYLKFNNDMFHRFDPKLSKVAFPSPRAWTKASKIWLDREVPYLKDKGLDKNPKAMEDALEFVLAGQVGKSAAREYMKFRELVLKYNPKDVLLAYTNPDKAPLPTLEKKQYIANEATALMAAIVRFKRGQIITPEEYINLGRYAERLKDPNYVSQLMTSTIDEHPYLNENSESFDPAYEDAADIIWEIMTKNYPALDRNFKEK